MTKITIHICVPDVTWPKISYVLSVRLQQSHCPPQRAEHSNLLAFHLIAIFCHNAANILGVTRDGPLVYSYSYRNSLPSTKEHPVSLTTCVYFPPSHVLLASLPYCSSFLPFVTTQIRGRIVGTPPPTSLRPWCLDFYLEKSSPFYLRTCVHFHWCSMCSDSTLFYV